MGKLAMSVALIIMLCMIVVSPSLLIVKSALAYQNSPAQAISIVYPTNGTVVNALMGSFSASWQYPANATFSWVGYHLNGSSWTPGGNHTVTGQNETRLFIGNDGDYTFSLYANDTAGNWATPQTVTFHIHVVGDELEYYKVAGIDIRALVLVVIILILIALAVLVAYKRNRKQVKKAKERNFLILDDKGKILPSKLADALISKTTGE